MHFESISIENEKPEVRDINNDVHLKKRLSFFLKKSLSKPKL